MGGSSKSVTVGYKYYVGMHMVLCHGPIDKLLRIQVDERDVWLGSREGGQITINQPEIFGGESREGGIQGVVDFETGHAGQGQNSYLVSKLGSLVPAFRGVVGMVLRQVYMGLNPYLKSWSFRLQRIHVRQNGLRQWYDSRAEIRIAGPFKQRQAFFFAIDNSGSMNTIVSGSQTRMDIVKAQLVDIFEQLNILRIDSKVKVDIGISVFATSASYSSWIDAQDSDFASIKTFVQNITALPSGTGSTNYEGPFIHANHYYGTNPNTGGRKDTMIFITDGLPEPVGTAAAAVATAHDMINRTGQFSSATNSDVDIYAINVDLSDTTYTQMLDNTPWDGVPVVTSSDTSALYSAVFFAIMGDSSAMNPAHIIRECLTDPLWGMGYLDSDIDDVSFMAAADKLYSENMGISIIWDTQSTIEDFIKLIARHIDATLYVDRITGKFVLKLIRSDYDESTLITLDESNIDNVSDFVRPAFGELTNSVTVSYWNAGIGDTSTLTVQDIALAQQQGANIGTSVSYEGFVDAITASRAAQRDLTALSTPIASCTIITNRIAENLNIGSVFKFSWKDYDISNMVMRVTSIAFGDGKTNRIRIQCAQDVFSLPDEAYIVPPPPAWEDPTQEPSPANIRLVFEVPYLELVQRQGQTAVDNLLQINNNPDAGYVGAGAVRPSSGMIAARLFTNPGSGYEDVSSLDFAPGAVLAEDIDQMATTFAISDLVESENIQLGTWFQMDDELMSVENISSSSITVKRGCLDTVPSAHTTGAGLVFWDVYAEADPTEYVASDVVGVKILTNIGSGQLTLAAAPENVVTLRSRAIRPYPPGDFKLNGDYFPAELSNDISVDWKTRNRVQQTGGTLIGFTDGDITPEAGTTYKIQVRNLSDSSLVYQENNATRPHVITKEALISGGATAFLELYLYSVRGGYDSYFPQKAVFNWTNVEQSLQAFLANGTFTVPPGVTSIDVLIVAGGGGGGSRQGGGGGGGGIVVVSNMAVTPGDTFAVVVGTGGAGGTAGGRGASGANSSFGSNIATGGGGGGGRTTDNAGANGGSGGGGGGGTLGGAAGGTGVAYQGYSGGASGRANRGGGGGGGGEIGETPPTTTSDYEANAGNGGNGLYFEAFTSYGDNGWFGGGGGGGGFNTLAVDGGGAGGKGGGGKGNGVGKDSPATPAGPGVAGLVNTGGGGGGSGAATEAGGAGGSGIVIVSWPAGFIPPTIQAGGAISDI